MKDNKIFYNDAKFEALGMDELEETQGGEIGAWFYNMRGFLLDIAGKEDSEEE